MLIGDANGARDERDRRDEADLERRRAEHAASDHRPDPACCTAPVCQQRDWNRAVLDALSAYVLLADALARVERGAAVLWPREGPAACREPGCTFERDMAERLKYAARHQQVGWFEFTRAMSMVSFDLTPEQQSMRKTWERALTQELGGA